MTDYALSLLKKAEALKRAEAARKELKPGEDPWSAAAFFERASEEGNTAGNDFLKGEIQYKGTHT